MEYSRHELDLIELKGRNTYLKRLSKEYFDEFSKFSLNECIETRMLAGTIQIPSSDDILMYLEFLTKCKSTIHMLIFKKLNNTIIGEVVLSEIDNTKRTANIRIEIGQKSEFCHGYGFESLFIILNYGFGMLNLNKIELDVLEDNIGAIKLYEKIGFIKNEIKEKAYYYNYESKNLVLMSILKEQFIDVRKKNIEVIYA
jgi:hypothetical protein